MPTFILNRTYERYFDPATLVHVHKCGKHSTKECYDMYYHHATTLSQRVLKLEQENVFDI